MAKERTVTMLVGPQRCGTSVLTHLVSVLGGLLPKSPIPVDPRRNADGDFESTRLNWGINYALLRQRGIDPIDFLPGTVLQFSGAGIEAQRQAAANVLREEFEEAGPAVWKDPALCATLPFWKPILSGSQVIATSRNPLEVAHSLSARVPAISIEAGLAVWERNQRHALRNLQGWPVTFTTYERVRTEPTNVALQVLTFLRDRGVVLAGDIQTAVATVNQVNYRNRHSDMGSLSPEIRALWDVVQSLAGQTYDEFPAVQLGSETPSNSYTIAEAAPIARQALEHVAAHQAQVGAALI
jgi:hypothetical protein